MYTHGTIEAQNMPLKEIDLLALRIERDKDRLQDREIRDILMSRPRQRPETHH